MAVKDSPLLPLIGGLIMGVLGIAAFAFTTFAPAKTVDQQAQDIKAIDEKADTASTDIAALKAEVEGMQQTLLELKGDSEAQTKILEGLAQKLDPP